MIAAFAGAGMYRTNSSYNGTGCHEHPLPIKLDPYEAAYLTNGQRSVVDAAVASLIRSKFIEPSGSGFIKIDRDADCEQHPVVAELKSRLLAQASLERLDASKLRGLIASWQTRADLACIAPIKSRLVQHGLAIADSRAFRIAITSGLIAILPLILAIPKFYIGVSLHKPISGLILLSLVTGLTALAFAGSNPIRTSRGAAALKELQDSQLSLRETARSNPDALTPNQIALAAGLFGSFILANGTVGAFYRVLSPGSSSSASGSCSSGSSCSRCGGCGG